MNFVIGQTYRIRQWDDMKAEFGLDEDGDISPADVDSFVRSMAPLCGQEWTFHGNKWGLWIIEPWMVEPLSTEDTGEVLP